MFLPGSPEVAVAAPFFYILLISYALDALYYLFSRYFSDPTLLWVQMVGDVALVSAITGISEGARSPSPHSLLYFVVIIYAAILPIRKGGVIAAALSSASYFVVLILGRPDGDGLLLVAYRVYLHTLLFFLLGIMSSYLSERLARRAEFSDTGLTRDEMLENVLAGIMSLNRGGRISDFNRRAEEILELSSDELKDRHYQQLPDRLDPLKREMTAHLQTPETPRRKEVDITSRDGSKRLVGFTMNTYSDSLGRIKGVTVNFQDVTDRKYAERLAALGELSASMAHEIRNPLGAIRGATELLEESIRPETRDAKRLMELILRESDRVNRKIEEFLFLAKPREPVMKKTKLREPINQVVSLLKCDPSYSEDLKITKKYDGKTPIVSADSELLVQVFHNIAINAVNAMENKGRLLISLVEEGERVGVCFEDTGKGMRTEEIASIFKPFYSGDGKGIGLGLAVANQIVREHHGSIEVTSEVGKGSRFTIWFPAG
jgi:two-component system sensor histidine kinase PilS (NtrC family)